MVVLVGIGIFMVLSSLEENVSFFLTPAEYVKKASSHQLRFPLRLGGVVKEGSVMREESQLVFTLTDGTHHLVVHFEGILPQLFKEKQTVVVRVVAGEKGMLKADEVLAKHDENYTPPPLRQLTKKEGALS